MINNRRNPSANSVEFNTILLSIKALILMSLFSRTVGQSASFAEMAEYMQNQLFTVVNVEFPEQSGYMRPYRGDMDLHPACDLLV
jgi:hypothetical protein